MPRVGVLVLVLVHTARLEGPGEPSPAPKSVSAMACPPDCPGKPAAMTAAPVPLISSIEIGPAFDRKKKTFLGRAEV